MKPVSPKAVEEVGVFPEPQAEPLKCFREAMKSAVLKTGGSDNPRNVVRDKSRDPSIIIPYKETSESHASDK